MMNMQNMHKNQRMNTINEYKHPEVQYAAQEMYEYLDNAIQNIFSNPDTANPKALLQTANANMQNYLDEHINKQIMNKNNCVKNKKIVALVDSEV